MDQASNEPDWGVLQTLLEAATRDQRAIARATAAMDNAAGLLTELPRQVVPEICGAVDERLKSSYLQAADKLVEKFISVYNGADKARLAYERAARFAPIKFVLIALVLFAFGVLGMLAVAWFILPDFQTITQLRTEQANLQASISTLAQRGGRIETSQCNIGGGALKFCVRVDDHYAEFAGTDGKKYRIPYGY